MANAAHVSGCPVAVKQFYCGALLARALAAIAALVCGAGGNVWIGIERGFVAHWRSERPRREEWRGAVCKRVGKCRIAGFAAWRAGGGEGLPVHFGNQSA